MAAPSRPVPRGSAKAAKAQKRAMPLARLRGNGMDQADAAELHALADAGIAWHAAAERLGDRKLARARAALASGQRVAARDSFLQASACYRFGQVPLADSDPQKRPLYRRMLEAFREGGHLSEPRHDRIELPWRGGQLSGWLIPAAAPSPIVLQLCGIAGSREEYESGSRYLTARGLGAALVDAPGQGETRLVGGLHFDEHAVDAICALVDAVAAHPACNGRVGLWGNSAVVGSPCWPRQRIAGWRRVASPAAPIARRRYSIASPASSQSCSACRAATTRKTLEPSSTVLRSTATSSAT
jgi:hypothetical protein